MPATAYLVFHSNPIAQDYAIREGAGIRALAPGGVFITHTSL